MSIEFRVSIGIELRQCKTPHRTCLAAVTMQKRWNPGADLTKPRRRKLQAMQNVERHVRSAPGFHRFCIVAAARHVRWGILHRLKLSPLGFGQNRHLGSFVASFFFVFEFSGLLESHHCVAKSSPLGSVSMHENRVLWAQFPCMKTESSRLDFWPTWPV